MKRFVTLTGTILSCDKCGIEFELGEGPCICPDDTDGSQVEQLALEDDWVKDGDKIYCSECAPKIKKTIKL